MLKALVTGGSGFLGKYVVTALNSLHYNIDSIGRHSDATIKADISKHIPILSDDYDIVIHMAGKAHMVPETEAEKKEFYDVNLIGTQNLLKALQKPPKFFVFISSVSVYGLDFGDNIIEEEPLNAIDAYGKSKVMAEKLVFDWGETQKTIITILRLPLLFGINPPGNLKSIISAVKKKYYFNIGKGDVRKSMVFASDVAEFIPVIMKTGGIYNLTDGYHPSFKELSKEIAIFYGLRTPISIPYFLVCCIAHVGEFIQNVFKVKMPMSKRQFLKMTKTLTFSDYKAREKGWKPSEILKSHQGWLV